MKLFYLNSKVEIIINESDIDDVFQSICTTIISNIQKSLEYIINRRRRKEALCSYQRF